MTTNSGELRALLLEALALGEWTSTGIAFRAGVPTAAAVRELEHLRSRGYVARVSTPGTSPTRWRAVGGGCRG